MRTLEQLLERLGRYGEVEYIFDPLVGYVAWHYSTGDNLELLFIETTENQKGHGRELVRRMVERLLARGERPYHSIFAYHLGLNQSAARFYKGLGWKSVDLGRSIYGGDNTVLVWTEWSAFVDILGIA